MKIQEVFLSESNLVSVSSPIVLVGDVHGQFYDVLKLLSLGNVYSIKPESHPIHDLFLSETSWIEDTTLYKQ